MFDSFVHFFLKRIDIRGSFSGTSLSIFITSVWPPSFESKSIFLSYLFYDDQDKKEVDSFTQ